MAEKKTETTKEKAKTEKKTEVSKTKPKISKKEIKPKVAEKAKPTGEGASPTQTGGTGPRVEIKIPAVEKVKKEEPKKIIKAHAYSFKMFGIWDTKGIQVLDQGMKRYISLEPVYIPSTHGRAIAKQFWKSKKPIIERLANKLFVSGHKGKKHWRSSAHNTGKKLLAFKIIIDSFKIIEQKTKKNPVEILVRAIETGAPREGITTIEYGGVRYPKAVDLSPQRRIDLALRWIAQGAYQSAASGATVKKKIPMALAEQIMLTAEGNNQAFCVSKKIDLERQAAASR